MLNIMHIQYNIILHQSFTCLTIDTCSLDKIGDLQADLSSNKCIFVLISGNLIKADGMSNPWLASGGYSSMCRKPCEGIQINKGNVK